MQLLQKNWWVKYISKEIMAQYLKMWVTMELPITIVNSQNFTSG